MSKLIQALFPEGQRKVMVNLVVIAVAVALEKLGGGLSKNMETILIAVAGIFTGGNVLSGIGAILANLKGTKVGQIIEDIIPGDQGLGTQKAVVAAVANAEQAAEAAVQRADEHDERFDLLEKKLAVQAQNLSQIVQILNQSRQPAQGGRVGPAPGPQGG